MYHYFVKECDGFHPVSCKFLSRWAQHVNVFGGMLNSRTVIYEFTDPKFEEYIADSTEATLIIQECVVTDSQRSLNNDCLSSCFFLTMLVLEPGASSSQLLW